MLSVDTYLDSTFFFHLQRSLWDWCVHDERRVRVMRDVWLCVRERETALCTS